MRVWDVNLHICATNSVVNRKNYIFTNFGAEEAVFGRADGKMGRKASVASTVPFRIIQPSRVTGTLDVAEFRSCPRVTPTLADRDISFQCQAVAQ